MSAATYLTNEDVQNYGSDLLDVTQRAALDAVVPALQHLEQQNVELQRRLAVEARRNLDAAVERAVPNFREVDRDPRWHSWLSGVDILTGRARQVLLNDAIASTDAGRVAAFFRKFQSEVGDQSAGAQASSTASNRTRSSSGKQLYTRDQVKQLYRAHQQGAYAGREVEWARQEADIIRASGEGRILGGTDVAGK
jgi:hypothetical protein